MSTDSNNSYDHGRMVLILGVTASGKGRLAFDLARQRGAQIVSIDSMKVYRRMDIGTAKPSPRRRQAVPYHMIDVVEPNESFSVGMFLEQSQQAIAAVRKAGRPVIAVGGTALYIKALLQGLFEGPGSDQAIRNRLADRARTEGLESLHRELTRIDPIAAERIHQNDRKRIIRALEVYRLTGKPISSFQQQWTAQPRSSSDWILIGLRRRKEDASSRINERVKQMIEAGLVEEVRALLNEEQPLSKQARCAIGYAEIIEHLRGRMPLDKAIERIKINTRRLAKGQRTWFKTFKDVRWLDIESDESPQSILNRAADVLDSLD